MASPDALLGTWKMVSWTKEVVATGETCDALGPDPVGYISCQPDGDMMALVVRSDRASLASKIHGVWRAWHKLLSWLRIWVLTPICAISARPHPP